MKFLQQDYFRYKRLGKRWRKPKGRQSKMLRAKNGAGLMPSIGYRSPRSERDLINGRRLIVVHTMNDLKNIHKDQCVSIASTIGMKKTLVIAGEARKLGIQIINNKKIKRSEKMDIILKEKRKMKKPELKETKKEIKPAKKSKEEGKKFEEKKLKKGEKDKKRDEAKVAEGKKITEIKKDEKTAEKKIEKKKEEIENYATKGEE